MKGLVSYKKEFEAIFLYVPKGSFIKRSGLINIGFSLLSYWKVTYSTGTQANDKDILISIDEYCGSYANIVPTKDQRIRRQK